MYLGRPHLHNARQKTNPGSQGSVTSDFKTVVWFCTPADYHTDGSPPIVQAGLFHCNGRHNSQNPLGPGIPRLDVGFCGGMEPLIHLRMEAFTFIDSDELITTHLKVTTLDPLLFKSTPGLNCLSNRTLSTKPTKKELTEYLPTYTVLQCDVQYIRPHLLMRKLSQRK